VVATKEEAEAALNAALATCAEAYEWNGVLSGLLIIAEYTRLDDEDDEITSLITHIPARQTWTRTIGLLIQAEWLMRKDFLRE
jgi:hypothetical protein